MNNKTKGLQRQLQHLSTRLAHLLKNKSEENREEAQNLAAKINQLVAHLSRWLSRRSLRRTMGGVALLFGLAAAQPAAAQSFAAPLTNPFGLAATSYIGIPTMVDIDGDGDLDVFVGQEYGDKLYYKNIGTASSPQFAAALTNPFGLLPNAYSYNIVFADLDNDGDLDALMGEYGGNTRYFQNTGTAIAPQFAAGVQNPFGLSATSLIAIPTFGDMDNDGDYDLMVGEYYGAIKYFQNTGTTTAPQFAAAVTNPFGLTSLTEWNLPNLVDLDNDGDLDLLTSEYEGDLKYFQNTGTATIPAFAAALTNPFNLLPGDGIAFIASGDLDNDSDIDVLIGEYYGVLKYYKNTSINIGIGELGSFDFKLYPNPTHDVVRIDAGTDVVKSIEILTLSGSVLETLPFVVETIDLSNYPTGLYLLKLTNKNGSVGFQKISKI